METKANIRLEKKDIVYKDIQNKIFNHILMPGTIISELKLSKELQISRATIRAALNRLEYIKIVLESMIAKKAAEKINEKQKRKLSSIINDFKTLKDNTLSHSALFSELVKEYHRIDDLFHKALIDIADNRRAREIIQNLNLQWCQQKTGILAVEGHMHISISEHIDIGNAVIEQKSSLAEQLVKKHLSKLKNSLVSLTKAFNYPRPTQ